MIEKIKTASYDFREQFCKYSLDILNYYNLFYIENLD